MTAGGSFDKTNTISSIVKYDVTVVQIWLVYRIIMISRPTTFLTFEMKHQGQSVAGAYTDTTDSGSKEVLIVVKVGKL